MGKSRTLIDNQGKRVYIRLSCLVRILLTFIVGFSSGLFGIGGGSILVPAMILLFLFPPHVAVGTSMFMVFLSAIVNSITHISLGNVPWLYTIPVIPAGILRSEIRSKIKPEDEV